MLSYIRLTQRTKRTAERGDTIVEVLLAVAVLGTVLGSAYVVVNRNVKNAQMSQERSLAVKVAESQLERLKMKSATTPSLFNQTTPFCLNQANAIETTLSQCRVNAAGQVVTEDPSYQIVITSNQNITYQTSTGTRFKITVSWVSLSGVNSKIDYYYEVYR